MINLEALRADILYPVPETTLIKALLDNGLGPQDEYAGASEAFEIAKANAMTALITAANISEGGYSLSINGKEYLQKAASSIYKKYGMNDPFDEGATAAMVNSPKVW